MADALKDASFSDDPEWLQKGELKDWLPEIYGELRALARSSRYRWDQRSDMGTTSLVHEAYIRLSHKPDSRFHNQQHFFRVASRVMRSVLIDNVRRHMRQKRQGEASAETYDDEKLVSQQRGKELLALDDALNELERTEPDLVRVVECRSFGGLNIEETAQALGISNSTVKRRWTLACSLLFSAMDPQNLTKAAPQ